jgi:ariadne-1
MSWIEVQFLAKAVRALTDARTVLRDTYVFAYYLVKNNQCQIFENNQRDLEMSTENLSGYLEGEATDADLREMKQKVGVGVRE